MGDSTRVEVVIARLLAELIHLDIFNATADLANDIIVVSLNEVVGLRMVGQVLALSSEISEELDWRIAVKLEEHDAQALARALAPQSSSE